MHNKPTTTHSGNQSEANGGKLDLITSLDIFTLLQPQPGERILDLGCGAGDFTAKIAATGAIPTGIDYSEEMIKRARQKYSELHFQVEDASQYRTDIPFDAVFSHATIHWIKDAPAVVRSIGMALREGGRFVAEFAGSGNVAVLTAAMKEALEDHGYEWTGRNPWYFPTIGEYSGLLEQAGFRVTWAQHFDNPSPLKHEAGIHAWLNGVANQFFSDVSAEDKASIYSSIEDKVKPRLLKGNQWMIDTSRLRIIATKKHSE